MKPKVSSIMQLCPVTRRFLRFCAGLILLGVLGASGRVSAAEGDATLMSFEGKVEVMRAGGEWIAARTNIVLSVGDSLRSGARSRALLRLENQTVVRLDANAYLRLEPPPGTRSRSLLNLFKGALFFFHRDEPVEAGFKTPLVSGAIRGTEFTLEVEENGRTVVTLIEGVVGMTSSEGEIRLVDGEMGVCEVGGQLTRKVGVDAVSSIQWCLYYPAVMHVRDMGLEPLGENVLKASVEAYLAGDVLKALELYPEDRKPIEAGERVYLATLVLAVGRIDEARELVEGLPEGEPVERLIAAVTGVVGLGDDVDPVTPSAHLAESYVHQSRFELERALQSARAAVQAAGDFGYAWIRLAELEFGFGRVDRAQDALARGLALSSRHAQGVVVQGFLHAARNERRRAAVSFGRAIELDSALGTAWLGRGLVRISQGDLNAGKSDLLVATSLEPARSLWRSYLAKAWEAIGDDEKAEVELDLAKRLDPADPTPWLYGALLNQRQNRINDAVEDLERSKGLNDERRLYRSRFLLDEDQATRSANLAGVYRDAGMGAVSVHEASMGVARDYANYGSHLFLGNSYLAQEDPGSINQRFESARVSEFLMASLLSPVAIGTLSQRVSQEEYSRLFDRDRLGLLSQTEYGSQGDWRQHVGQFGQFGRIGYALSFDYLNQTGQRVNQDVEEGALSLSLKIRLAPRDHLYLMATGRALESGDLAQYYDPNDANPGVRVEERQEGFVLAGYHREWQPGIHTLLLAGRLPSVSEVMNPEQFVPSVVHPPPGDVVTAAFALPAEQDYETDVEIYTAEVQQIFQSDHVTLIAGGRFQTGTFQTRNEHTMGVVTVQINPTLSTTFFPSNFDLPAQDIETDFQRWTAYAYPQVTVGPFTFSGGVTYDRLRYPVNFRYPPLQGGEDETERVSPKAGVQWRIGEQTSLRAAYSRTLGGVSFDQSFGLEPTQIAGINQTWRTLIPESVESVSAAERFETWGAAFHHRFQSRTYLTVQGEVLSSDAERVLGVFDLRPTVAGTDPFIFPSGAAQSLDFRERSVSVAVDQLLGERWAVGVNYRVSEAEFNDSIAGIPSDAALLEGFRAENQLEALLHRVWLHGTYNHSCGFFTSGRARWYGQSNSGYEAGLDGDSFWQFDLFAGYRFPGRRAELRVGLLNLTDQDYRLNPLNIHQRLPRERTVTGRFTVWF